MLDYDVAIIGAGPGGLYAALELVKNQSLKIAIIEEGKPLEERKCPMIDNGLNKCLRCNSCSVMQGYGGAGAKSDGKVNITNDFGGMLYSKIGKKEALELMREVDKINVSILEKNGAEIPKLYSSANSELKKEFLQHKLHLMEADIRHLGTDNNYIILSEIYKTLKLKNVNMYFNTKCESVVKKEDMYIIECSDGIKIRVRTVIMALGRSGSKKMQEIAEKNNWKTRSNRVDIGVRVELPYDVFSHITDKLYESKIVYRTENYEDTVRTFCMNPKGIVVNENTNGIITVNGHSFENSSKHTSNTNFALLVSQNFTEPFNDSNAYGESIAKLSNMLGNGVIVQRFGDLIRSKRTNASRLSKSTVSPTLKAEPGDLSLVLPKRILDDIIEMIYALDKVAPGTANDDTLLYGVEVKFYNMEVEVDSNLMVEQGVYVIGDGSGVTHSLSQAAASGLFVARQIS